MKLWQLWEKVDELMNKHPNLEVYANIDSHPALHQIADIRISKTGDKVPIIEIYIDDTE